MRRTSRRASAPESADRLAEPRTRSRERALRRAAGAPTPRLLPSCSCTRRSPRCITFVLRPTSTYRAIELDVPGAWLGALTRLLRRRPAAARGAVRAGHRPLRGTPGDARRRRSHGRCRGGLRRRSAAARRAWCSAPWCSAPGTCSRSSASRPRSPTPRRRAVSTPRSATTRSPPRSGRRSAPALIILLGGRASIPDTSAIFLVRHGARRRPRRLHRPPAHAPRPTGAGGAAVRRRCGPCCGCPACSAPCSISCIVLAAVDITLVYLPALGADRGLAAGFIGLLLTLRAVASMASRFFLGRLVARIGRRRLMIAQRRAVRGLDGGRRAPLPRPASRAIVVRPAGPRAGRRSAAHHVVARAVAPAGSARPGDVAAADRQPARPGAHPERGRAVAAGVGAAGVLWATAAGLAVATTAARGMAADGPAADGRALPATG